MGEGGQARAILENLIPAKEGIQQNENHPLDFAAARNSDGVCPVTSLNAA
jgi:hypothetical protein